MGYVITNERIYIRLSENGAPVSTSKKDAQVFTKEKAENILKALPKVLKNFHLNLKYVPDEKKEQEEEEKKYIKSDCYKPCDEVVEWIQKAESLHDFSKNIRSRKDILHKKLSNVDKELSNCMHEIELSKWKNGSEGYKEYRAVKEVLEKRRKIKDELIILQSISQNIQCNVNIKNIRKAFNRLGTRRFEIRIIEDDFEETNENE